MPTKIATKSTNHAPAKRAALPPDAPSPWQIGTCYLIRTVVYYALGRLVGVWEHELLLEEASWIADTGRFHEALRTGKLAEVEPFVSPVIVGRLAIVDAAEWPHPLPVSVI